jgi:hypothetical protein
MDMANKRSLYLNDNWDITLDGNGDITTTSGLYCDAQNVANATRLFTKDAYLAQTKGIPHFDVELGVIPALSEVRSWYRRAAMAVDNIQSASIDITAIDDDTRTLRGIITATVTSGETLTVEI